MRALTERAPELFTHLEGVAELAEATARRLGMNDEEAECVRHAAELQDVGKVAIPDAILTKPGPLDPHEWEFIRRHTLIGERIVSAAPALGAVARLVRSSHERWDGTGYPDRLLEQEIPLGARVVGVIDAFDAMTSERPYSPAVSPAAALASCGAARARSSTRWWSRRSARVWSRASGRDDDRHPPRRRTPVGVAGLRRQPRLEAVAGLHERAAEAVAEAEASLPVGLDVADGDAAPGVGHEHVDRHAGALAGGAALEAAEEADVLAVADVAAA